MSNTARTFNHPMIPAVGMSLVFSLLLFGLLYSVIRIGHHKLEKSEALPTIDFVRLKRDSEVETLARRKPPPPPAQPPPPAKMKIVSDSAGAQAGLSGLEIPNLNLKADVGGSMVGGNKGSAAAAFDGDIIPMNCPQPVYPADAKRAGLTGWVVVQIVVGADGSARSVKALDAQPKNVFEAAAVMSQQRCKFKPRMVDGKPVEQTGKRKLNFGLTGSPAE